MAATTGNLRTMLNASDDWELWYEELKASSTSEFWPMADPDKPDILPKDPPKKPEITDIVPDAVQYTTLSTANQRIFDNARKHYEVDIKEYTRQDTALNNVRRYIVETIYPNTLKY